MELAIQVQNLEEAVWKNMNLSALSTGIVKYLVF